MSNVKKLMMTAAGGEALNVEDVFSTYLYDGTGSALTVTNDVNLSDEGGMVWVKRRDAAVSHYIFDTERGVGNYIITNSTAAQNNLEGISAFNTDGFSVGTAITTGMNTSGGDYASWTFRKAPKFFDVVTYTGNGTAGRTVSHNLGSVPGCIMVKCTNTSRSWMVYHRGMDASSPENYHLALNANFGLNDLGLSSSNPSNMWDQTAPTSTEFTVGSDSNVNASGNTYVAYLFAHNDGDGEFGPTGDQDIIKCGTFTTNASSGDIGEVDLGFEPQFILFKGTTSTSNWFLWDTMRGLSLSSLTWLHPNTNDTDSTVTAGPYLHPTATGFNGTGNLIGKNLTVAYIAIRRGPMAVPESATDVFDVVTVASPSAPLTVSNNIDVTDTSLVKSTANVGSPFISQRLTGNRYLLTDSTSAEKTNAGTNIEYDFNYKVKPWFWTSGEHVYYFWKRAPNFFDVVAYTGNGTAGRTVSHNLGVAPEMIWVKGRTTGSADWAVWHTGLSSNSYHVSLNTSSSEFPFPDYWNGTAPTDAVFSLGTDSTVNNSSHKYIAYLFASLDGISKVGSYTGNATNNRVIDCGFSSGARFVLIKEADNVNYWFLFDSERGITTASTDGVLRLNETTAQAAESTYGGNLISPHNSGFMISNLGSLNNNGGSYIFYAIA